MAELLVEPFGGLAGDMFLAALLDLGDPAFTLEALQEFVEATLPGEARLVATDVTRRGLGGTHLEVVAEGTPPVRHPDDLARVVAASPLGPAARGRALDAIERLAEAEARVHRVPREEVHFHELGAVDTIVDVAGAAFALERLGVETFEHAEPYVGGGTVRTAHGELPVPAPATAALLLGLDWRQGSGGERTTPTGAALLRAFGRPVANPRFAPRAVGYGAGTRDGGDGPPNLVRVLLGEGGAPREGLEAADELAFQLDDATGEEVGFLVEGLFAAGALDVWTTSLQMKKGRPGVGVAALARPGARAALEQVAFQRSPTLGLRWRRVERRVARRAILEVEVEGRRIRVKRRVPPGAPEGGPPRSAWDLSPEYEDLAAWARATGRPLPELAALAVAAARARLGDAAPGETPS